VPSSQADTYVAVARSLQTAARSEPGLCSCPARQAARTQLTMAHIIRTPKSASDWTHNELRAYHIVVRDESVASFFGVDVLPEPNCPRDFLTESTSTPNTDPVTDDLIWNMEDASADSELGEGPVDLFARSLFVALGFTSKAVHPSVRRPLQLMIGSEPRSAQVDVCLIHDRMVLLLVQEDKAGGRPPWSGEAQLVAEAVAARQRNVLVGAVPENATIVVPAILMVGTYPVFYKIPVGAELDASVVSLAYPAGETEVARCVPEVPRPGMRYRDGMYPLDSRVAILRYFEAFRRHIFVPCSEATLGVPLDLPPPRTETGEL